MDFICFQVWTFSETHVKTISKHYDKWSLNSLKSVSILPKNSKDNVLGIREVVGSFVPPNPITWTGSALAFGTGTTYVALFVLTLSRNGFI